MSTITVNKKYLETFEALGIDQYANNDGDLKVYSPVDGALIGSVQMHSPEDIEAIARQSVDAFKIWRSIPAPKRGEFVRIFGDELRQAKDALGTLVTIECGKSKTEGDGEVQEMIDICDFAVGLARQIDGQSFPSERPDHILQERYHPLGPVGIISAFNFPVAVWSWNTALAWVCGDSTVWKPSEKTPLTALACQNIFNKAAERFEKEHDIAVPEHLSQIFIGERDVGEAMVDHPAFPLISATGSTRMGCEVGQRVARRFGRSILELGGNNAIIVAPSANQNMALRGVAFGAVGTAGQRCTTTRRLIVHEGIYEEFLSKLVSGYRQLKIGNPTDPTNHVGPLIDEAAVVSFEKAVEEAEKQGGKILAGGKRVTDGVPGGGFYVEPTIIEMDGPSEIASHETFAPILYVFRYKNLDEAIAMNNDVPQGLSSAIFTDSNREAEYFKSVVGSDCGIANVNIGTSGAEIGGAFGGEKETGGGRESGSDSWKIYMRRQTQTTNHGDDLPLAQGVEFDL